MEHTVFNKVILFALSFLVLFSTLSFAVEKHYCGGTLVDMSVFSKVKGCGMELESKASIAKSSCCKNEVDIIEGQDELSSFAFNDIDISVPYFIVAFQYSYIALYQSLPKRVIPHKDYSPPNIVYDIHILDQVFLI